METEKFHNLQSVLETNKASDIIQSMSKDLRARAAAGVAPSQRSKV